MRTEKHLAPLITPLEPIPTGLTASGGLTPPLQAVIFDIYGTLLISGTGDIGTLESRSSPPTGMAALCRRYSVSLAPEELKQALTRSIRHHHDRRQAAGVAHPEVDIVSIWREVLGWSDMGRLRAFAVEYEMIVNPVYPMPGLLEVLAVFQNTGISMGIVSNAQFYTKILLEFFLEAPLDHVGFLGELVVFSFELGEAKPSSVLFDRCADGLGKRGIPPEAAAYVGNDMLNDIFAAQRAGFQTVLFAGDRRSLRLREGRPECRGCRADAVVTDLRQLPGLFGLDPA